MLSNQNEYNFVGKQVWRWPDQLIFLPEYSEGLCERELKKKKNEKILAWKTPARVKRI